MAAVDLRDLTVRFGDFTAVDAINLGLGDGEFVVFLGPSGCGKTTTLRCIAGLETPTAGDILFDGRRVNELHATERNVAMVFQFVSLYPHLSVRENIAFPLRARGVSRSVIREKIDWVTGIFDLAPILDQRPGRLPPGARQKAALARSVVRDPNVLLLDEPLSAIDEQFREEMRWELRHLQQRLGVTSVYVTHDQREAMSLADRVVLMRDGRIVQAGPPAELYEDPADRFAAFFIGSPSMNFLPARLTDDGLAIGREARPLKLPAPLRAGLAGHASEDAITLGVRPQHVSLGGRSGEAGVLDVPLIGRYQVGRERWFDFEIGGEICKGRVLSDDGRDGGEVPVTLDLDRVRFFAADGRRLRWERPS